jgi:hypothetical protein
MLAEIYVNEQQYRRRVKGEKNMEYGCVSRDPSCLWCCGVPNETLEAKPTKT